MPLYKSPEAGEKYFRKFVRAEGEIFVAEGERDLHLKIVDRDNLQDRIDQLRDVAPFELDAGIISTRGPQEIIVWENSSSLELPLPEVRREARQITRLQVALLSPNHKVQGLK